MSKPHSAYRPGDCQGNQRRAAWARAEHGASIELRDGTPPYGPSRPRSLQVPSEVLVHLEHGRLVLAEDLAELVVGQDLAAVLRVLQVVGLNVVPDLAHHLAAR